jgi:hypothetical protein
MASDKDLLKHKKETLLAELESIKHLLVDDQNDHIPVLKDAIIEETAELSIEPSTALTTEPSITRPMSEHLTDNTQDNMIDEQDIIEIRQSIYTEGDNLEDRHIDFNNSDTTSSLSNITPEDTTETTETQATHTHANGVLPGQQSLFNQADSKTNAAKVHHTDSPPPSSKQASLSNNPFLPPHVRERFKEAEVQAEHKKQLIDEPKTQTISPEAIINASYTERLIDQLVAHHLPKIEAELRLKLLAVVKMHNEKLKK